MLAFRYLALIVPMLSLECSSSTTNPPADASVAPGDGSSIEIPGWRLVFDDEFDGTALDPSKGWGTYDGWQSNSPGFTHFSSDNISVQNGWMRLKLERRSIDGSSFASGGVDGPMSTILRYGRWVVRARFPAGKGYVGYMGLFAPDWMNGTEIDFAEVASKTPMNNDFTQHYSGGQQEQYTATQHDWTAELHEFTVIWEEGTLIWLIDGQEVHRMVQHFQSEPLGFAMGDWAAPCDNDWAGCPDSSTPSPSYMDIDYVRVYQKQ
jgi:beta-glucanase (GH16 family)